jgi:hypothetical protein
VIRLHIMDLGGGVSDMNLPAGADVNAALAKYAVKNGIPLAVYNAATITPAEQALVDAERAAYDAAQAAVRTAALKQAIKTAYQAGAAAAERSDRAIVKLTVDELNDLRNWVMSFKAVVSGAGTFAALKTAVAGLPNLPARTYAQARNAYDNAVDGDA